MFIGLLAAGNKFGQERALVKGQRVLPKLSPVESGETQHLLLLLLEGEPEVSYTTCPYGGGRRGELPVEDMWQRREDHVATRKSCSVSILGSSPGRVKLDVARPGYKVSTESKVRGEH